MRRLLQGVIAILLLLLLIFFGAGLVVPEVEYETEITIDLPIDEVWKQFNDIQSIDQWIPEVKSVEPINEEPGIRGSRYSMTVDNGGQEMIMTETITEFVPEERVSLTIEGGQMIKNDTFSFIALDGRTKIVGRHRCRGQGYLHQCMFAFFKTMFKNIDQTSLERFKSWIERENNE